MRSGTGGLRPRVALGAGLGLVGQLCLLSSAGAWYPYSDRYARWQEARPLTMGAWHSAVARDRLPERVARYKAAGLDQIFFLKLPRACDWGWIQAVRDAATRGSLAEAGRAASVPPTAPLAMEETPRQTALTMRGAVARERDAALIAL